MDPRYDHTKYEGDIYKTWEESGAFTPGKPVNKSTNKPFCIIMPPPNANDPLHIGHARFVAIEDVIIRYQRMKGNSTLWLPGSDHAGIETQFVFEKKLAKEGKSRFDYDRDTLYQMIWDYVQENTGVMHKQLRQLGASCDWTRHKFTLDPDIVKIVYQTFKKLYTDGLIYRGERIVNYCPRCGTAYSQLEVEFAEREDNLYYLDYGTIQIATTRPETIFADVAVAVNPNDPKYKHLFPKTVQPSPRLRRTAIGQVSPISAQLPLINRELPIIADVLVDKDFGTGALKITPGHDPVDFEIGQKHKLPIISVIDDTGHMTSTPQKYVGLKPLAAREEVVKDLQAKGLIKKIEPIKHMVGTCYRCHGLIEPTISKQWFLKVKPLTTKALAAIKSGEVKFIAKQYERIATHWLKNLRDWNISRQIVWGIRIPAYRCSKCLEWTITDGETPKNCGACGHEKLSQDPDTFDTWFSSGQWPFATLKTTNPGDFETFYPTSLMETAYEIIPFWVIRMLMLGLFATGEVPFREVLIHGLVRDREGAKISKSKGNVIDPIIMAQKYGADALRMGIIWGALVERDVALDEQKIVGQRNFANKIWNIARFVLANKPAMPNAKLQMLNVKSKNPEDKWILRELKETTKKVTKSLDKYRANEAAEEIYDFVWHKFADQYIEKVKEPFDTAQDKREGEKVKVRENAIPILYYVLNCSLKLLHPFMPFITEVVWSLGFAKDKKDLLISSSWPNTR